MSRASQAALERAGISADQIDLVVPHQANLRIIESVAKHSGISMDRVFVTVQKYGNMSSATVAVALVEALEEGRVKPGSLLLTPAFGGGLTWCSHVIRWGDRVTPLGTTDIDLPPCTQTAVEIVKDIIKRKSSSQRCCRRSVCRRVNQALRIRSFVQLWVASLRPKSFDVECFVQVLRGEQAPRDVKQIENWEFLDSLLHKLRKSTESLIEKVDNHFGDPFLASVIPLETHLPIEELFRCHLGAHVRFR
jgi:hypothetical protein